MNISTDKTDETGKYWNYIPWPIVGMIQLSLTYFLGFQKPIKDFYLRKEIVVNEIAFIPMCQRFSVEDTICFSPFNLVCRTFSFDHMCKI